MRPAVLGSPSHPNSILSFGCSSRPIVEDETSWTAISEVTTDGHQQAPNSNHVRETPTPQQHEPHTLLSAERGATKTSTLDTKYRKNPHTQNFNLSLAMHRFFSFPLLFRLMYKASLLHMLAELGLYFEIENERAYLSCQFCALTIFVEEFGLYFSHGIGYAKRMILEKKKQLNCKISCMDSKNVPMGQNVDSKLNYKFEAHRLYSLLKKLDWQFVEPFELAKSGFYYTGDGDNVRCAFCNLEVRGWEEGDTPNGEHKRWNPNCPFLQSAKSVINIPIGREQTDMQHDGLSRINIGVNPFSVSEGLKKYGNNIRFVKQDNNFLVTSHDLNIQDWSAPLNPKFATLKSRIDSFRNFWPKSHKQTPKDLAQAGFFYTGTGDRAICFHCNLGLKDWDPNDDPFVQHCKWNSSCQYLLMCKGPRYVEQVLHTNKNMSTPNNAPIKSQGDGEMRCLKCALNNVSKVNLPCGHMSFCSSCPDIICGVCNEEIISEIIIPGFL